MERWKRARSMIESALLEEEMQTKLQLPSAAPIYIAAGMADLFQSRQPAQADVWFRRALGVDRQNAQAWYGLALASWEQGNMDAALNAAQEAMRYQAPHVPAATLCAQILMVRGEMAPALAMAEQTLQLLHNPGVAQMRLAHYPRLYPEREVLLRVKGRAAFEQGRFAEAFAALDQVVRRYTDARFFAACALFHLGRYAEATERLKDYLSSKDGAQDSRGYLYLGCALHAQGPQNLRAALNALDACLAGAKPGMPERLRALLERGQIYEERGQLEQAQRDYEAALEIERAPLTCYVLAALYHRSGRDQDAYDLLATVSGNPQGASAQGATALAGLEAGRAAPPPSGNTLVLMQPNEPVDEQIRRLMEILRERLAERAKRSAEEQAQQAVPQDEAPTASEELPRELSNADASDTLPAPAESLTAPRKAKRTSTKPKSGARKSAPVEQASDDMPTVTVEGAQAQVKRGASDDGAREE